MVKVGLNGLKSYSNFLYITCRLKQPEIVPQNVGWEEEFPPYNGPRQRKQNQAVRKDCEDIARAWQIANTSG